MQNTFLETEIPIKKFLHKISWHSILVFFIILAAILTRFINLGERVMSHDETNHVVPSYDLYSGIGYQHNPISHGPLQFHLIALSYFLFGDNDFSSRIPHALASVATIIFILFAYRKYFGKTGSIITAILFLISPYLMFYGRYARNEAFIGLFLVIILYALIHYYEKSDVFSLYLISIVLSLEFTSKETAYIHTAIFMIYFFVTMLAEILHSSIIPFRVILHSFLLILIIFASLLGSIYFFRQADFAIIDKQAQLIQNSNGQSLGKNLSALGTSFKTILPGLIPLVLGFLAILHEKKFLHWDLLSISPAFNIFILITTLVLPLLAAFPTKFCGYDPIAYTSVTSNLLDFIYLVYLSSLSILLGLTWKKEVWLKAAGIFYFIFFIFYTTFLTNMQGALTGMIGSLGYWLAQQGVKRGNQPLYYYALLQMPFYEFIGLAGALLAIILALFNKKPKKDNEEIIASEEQIEQTNTTPTNFTLPKISLFLFLGISFLIAFSIAGEKMPQLTLHITIPFLLLTGMTLGNYFDSIPWHEESPRKKWKGILINFFVVADLFSIFIILLGNNLPFQGKTQAQLQNTYAFLFRILFLALMIILQHTSLRSWPKIAKSKVFIIAIFILLAGITCQSALRASFVNYDYATEFLVYAHAAPDPKEILSQVDKISRKLTGGLNLQVAYDNDALYPFWWYFRHYPNRITYMENVTRNLLSAPIIIAGQNNYDSVEALTRKEYYSFEYFRLWWPNQDYFNLTLDRIISMLKSADMRQALFNIWFKRDYTFYAKLTNNDFLDVKTWSPSQKMRMYVRQDIADEVWDILSEDALVRKPAGSSYAAITTTIDPIQFIGGDKILSEPRGIDIAPDGSIYVADTRNNQIKHFSPNGTLIKAWGSYGNVADGNTNAAGGTFNEPWDVAVSNDEIVYVTDTWNHRIQKFTSDGQFLSMWGYFGIDNSSLAYYGPRGITVDTKGYVYFSDTGNKRIMVFDKNDHFVIQIGNGGVEVGQFNEPVGIALDKDNHLYITDTWNSRVQVIESNLELNTFTPLLSWNVEGWYGQSANNKPFIAVNKDGNVFITDPEGSLIFEYSPRGELLHAWDIRGISNDVITMPVDIDFAEDGTMWVSDAANNMIYAYDLTEYKQVEEKTEITEQTPTVDFTIIKESQLNYLHNKTHQDFINAAYKTAQELNISPWVLIRSAGWGHFTDDRSAFYTGKHILDIQTLDEMQKELLLKYLGVNNIE